MPQVNVSVTVWTILIRLAETDACKLGETYVVGNGVPFQLTVHPEPKTPESVSVNPGPPATTEVGLMPVIDGAWTVSGTVLDGGKLGLTTVMLSVPG